jgi:uncharacterized protein
VRELEAELRRGQRSGLANGHLTLWPAREPGTAAHDVPCSLVVSPCTPPAQHRAILDRLSEVFGERLRSAALFGSRARGDARDESDLDLLLVVARREATDYADAARKLDDAGLWRDPPVSLVIWSSSELESHPWLLMDVATDGVILLDDGQLARHAGNVAARLRAYGSRRVYLPDGSWYWDLKPDFKLGEVIRL